MLLDKVLKFDDKQEVQVVAAPEQVAQEYWQTGKDYHANYEIFCTRTSTCARIVVASVARTRT